MGLIQVMTTVGTRKNANKIAKHIVEKKVGACVQIIPIRSMYWWKKRIANTKELLLLIKGKDYKKIEKAIKEVHPYDVAEIIKVPIAKANKKYLDWIDKNA